MAKTATQMATNWQQAMTNPQTSTKYKQGIQNTTVNPMQKAASPESEALYLSRVQQSVASGKRAQKLNAVPVDRWKNNAINVGATQLSSGAQKAQDKVTQHFNKWAPVYSQMSDAARALPKGGMANAMARVQAAITIAMQAAGRS
jgi:X-X-X-Leu-X-X-Gly heptad repeat protein